MGRIDERSKIGTLSLSLPSGVSLSSNNVALDPEEPRDWPVVASYAEALRRVVADEFMAIILRHEAGDLDINVEKCIVALEQCRSRGILFDEKFVTYLYGTFLQA